MLKVPKLLSHYTEDLEEIFLRRTNSPELPLITLQSINRLIWGIPKKKMTLIAGRTSHGKTNMALNAAWDIAKQGHPVLFISLEMTAESLVERIFCYEKCAINIELQRGKFSVYREAWENFKKEFSSTPLVIGDDLGRGIKEIDAYLSDLDNKPEVVVIDHINEIRGSASDKKDAIDRYLDHMRTLSIQHNFALIICCQVNRMGQDEKDKKPKLWHLKGSGAIEEMTDLALLLFWEWHYDKTKNKNKFEVNIAKNRDGMTGYVDLIYRPEYCRFEDYEEPKEEKRSWGENEA